MSTTMLPAVHPRQQNPALAGADGYVAEIDALRALAVALVVADHAGLVPFGWTGVWIFFVVSGFAVTTSLQRAAAGSWRRRIGHFYARRCLRIWPLYFVFIAGSTAFLIATGKSAGLDELPYLLTFTYNMKLIAECAASWSPFGAMWTLAVEEQFYLFYPCLFVTLDRRRLSLVLVAVIIAAPMIRHFWALWTGASGWPAAKVSLSVYAFGPGHFDAFAAGALIALHRTWIERQAMVVRGCFALVVGLAIVYVATYVDLNLHRGIVLPAALRNVITGNLVGDLREIFVYSIIWGLAAGLLMLILTGERSVRAACHWPGVQMLGRVSFGVYMFNLPLFLLAQSILPSMPHPAALLLILASVFPASIALAWVSFHYLERPFLRLRTRVG